MKPTKLINADPPLHDLAHEMKHVNRNYRTECHRAFVQGVCFGAIAGALIFSITDIVLFFITHH